MEKAQNKRKFYTAPILLFFGLLCFTGHAQILLRNTTTLKTKQLNVGDHIFYQQKSDSTLGEIAEYDSYVVNFTDSTIILSDNEEISVQDFKYIRLENRKTKFWRGVASPFLVAGTGIYTRGLAMYFFEGLESKNAEMVPYHLLVGGALIGTSIWPFIIPDRTFRFDDGKWEIILP